MATITFSTPHALDLEAAAALPEGCSVDNGPDGSQVRLSLDPEALQSGLERVIAVARALPDAALSVEGAVSPLPEQASSSPAPPSSSSEDPWELVASRRFDEARAALAGTSLDSTGRDRVRELLQSTDPEEVALACDIAASTEWRSFVTSMKRVLGHADTRVRIAAVRAIGQLSGPAMIWQLEKLSGDSSPEVRQAVTEAVARIEGQSG